MELDDSGRVKTDSARGWIDVKRLPVARLWRHGLRIGCAGTLNLSPGDFRARLMRPRSGHRRDDEELGAKKCASFFGSDQNFRTSAS